MGGNLTQKNYANNEILQNQTLLSRATFLTVGCQGLQQRQQLLCQHMLKRKRKRQHYGNTKHIMSKWCSL